MRKRILFRVKLVALVTFVICFGAYHVVNANQSSDTIYVMSWDSQGKYVAYSGEAGLVEVFDTASSMSIYRWYTTPAINSLAFRPNSEEIALAESEAITIYSIQGSVRTKIVQTVAKSPTIVHWIDDGPALICGYSSTGGAKTVALLNTDSGSFTDERELGTIYSLAYSNVLNFWASGGLGLIQVWDQNFNRISMSARVSGVFGKPIWKILWSPTGSIIATGSQDGAVGIWSFSASDKTIDVLHVLRGSLNTSGYYNQSAILDMKFSADGQRLLTLGADGTLRMWDVGSGSLLSDESLGAPIRAGAFNPVNDTLALLRFNTPTQIISVSNKLENATPSPMPANTPSPAP